MTAPTSSITWRSNAERADKEFSFGDTISKQWLEAAFGIEYPEMGTKKDFSQASLKFFSAMETLRKELLLGHKKALKSLGRGEWLVVRPEDQSSLALETARRGIYRAVEAAEAINANVRTDLLDVRKRAEQVDVATRLAAFRVVSRGALSGAVPVRDQIDESEAARAELDEMTREAAVRLIQTPEPNRPE